MKKLISYIVAILLIAFLIGGMALQRVNAQTPPAKKPQPVSVKDTTIKGVTHKLYVGAKGGRYIIVISKTGNEYKRYFSQKKAN